MSLPQPCPAIPSPPFARLRHLAISTSAPPPPPPPPLALPNFSVGRSSPPVCSEPTICAYRRSISTANTAKPPPRSRLLLSCGESVLAVAERRTGASRCPIVRWVPGQGRLPRGGPGPMRPRCLSALSFVDRAALRRAPPRRSSCTPTACSVLGKADGFVLVVESLPVRFNGAVDGEVLIGPRRELYMTWQGALFMSFPISLTTQLQREASSYTAWQQVVADGSLELLTVPEPSFSVSLPLSKIMSSVC